MASFRVRPYTAEDREAVRSICFHTGFMGDSIAPTYADLESWADLFSGYFTDREPEHAWVACDDDGTVVGYLLGATQARRASAHQVRAVLVHWLLRFVFLRPGCMRFWWRFAFDVLRGARGSGSYDLRRFPAVLHIDLLEAARGTGTADALLRAYLDQLRAEGVAGCHAEILAANERVQRFFGRHGFTPEGPRFGVPGLRSRDGLRLEGQGFVVDLRAK